MSPAPDHEPSTAARPRCNLHASAVVVGEEGLLIRGPSGSGKTRLALGLVAAAEAAGTFARLVADDRTLVVSCGDRLVARPHPRIAGLVERRGLGLLKVDHEAGCRLSLVIDLMAEGWPPRLPDPEHRSVEIFGVTLPRITVASQVPSADAAALVLAGLSTLTTSS